MNEVVAKAQEGGAAVYFLKRNDRVCFKVGVAREPLERVKSFPEFESQQLDLAQSEVIWLPEAVRAQQIERLLHRGLRPFGFNTNHHGDGFSEWFYSIAFPIALRMVKAIPADNRDERLKPVGLLNRPVWVQESSLQSQPLQDVWLTVEDTWLRLASRFKVRVVTRKTPAGVAFDLVVVNFRGSQWPGAILAFRFQATDVQRYEWRQFRCSGNFLELIYYEGDDLVFRMTPLSQMKRWPEGEMLVGQVCSFLMRLERGRVL